MVTSHLSQTICSEDGALEHFLVLLAQTQALKKENTRNTTDLCLVCLSVWKQRKSVYNGN